MFNVKYKYECKKSHSIVSTSYKGQWSMAIPLFVSTIKFNFQRDMYRNVSIEQELSPMRTRISLDKKNSAFEYLRNILLISTRSVSECC